jgi:HlyD family secretion protein
MTKKLLLVPLLLAAAASGYWFLHAREAGHAGGDVSLYGNVDIREANLAFNASEHVREILVQEGDRVERGQVLAQLDTKKLEAAVAAAEAALQAQQQALARLQAGSRPEEIRRAHAQLDALKARARTAQITYERQQQLARQKLAAAEDLDQARAAADAAEGEMQAAEESYALAVAGPRVEDIAQARAELAGRRANLDLAREQLADATLTAPAAGIVRDRLLEPGDLASPQTPVLTLALVDPIWVRAYVPEPDLGRVAEGMAAEIRTDSFPGKVYRGWVGFVSPSAEFSPKNVETTDLRTRLVYQVRVFVCDPLGELRLGMPATVTIPTGQTPPFPATADRCAPQGSGSPQERQEPAGVAPQGSGSPRERQEPAGVAD